MQLSSFFASFVENDGYYATFYIFLAKLHDFIIVLCAFLQKNRFTNNKYSGIIIK